MPREYTRALNATKLERVFAKPFLASLDGHRDGVNCMAKHPKSLSTMLSGSCDGEVINWLTELRVNNGLVKYELIANPRIIGYMSNYGMVKHI